MKKLFIALIALATAFTFFIGVDNHEQAAQDNKVIISGSDPGAGGGGGS